MLVNRTIEDLPLCPVVSNIGATSYRLAKNSAKILSPLSKSEHTLDSATNILKSIRNLKIPNRHKKLSFDVKALFTKVLLDLDNNINLILRNTYVNHHEIDTNISRKIKDLHIFFDRKIYIQCNGIAMGQL